MALTIGVNSFVTLAEANSYLSEKFGAGSWSALPNSTKEQCLITAFRWLVRLGINPASLATKVKHAQIELAWWIYQYYVSYEKRGSLIAGGVKSFNISKWSESLDSQKLPDFIYDLVGDLINNGNYYATKVRELE